jgi:hypothetical protein
MSEFDDPILRDRLSRYAGEPPDSEAAFLGVQQRVRHVKRRRVAIWSGATAIVIGVGAANALQGSDGAKVSVPPTASTPVANTVATATSTTSTSTTATSMPAVTTTAPATTVVASTQPAPPEVTNPETALGNPDSADAATAAAGAPPTESATASRPSALPVAGEEHHRSSAGGTVGILLNGSLSLASATPTDGYAVRVDEDGGSRIRVVFERGAASSTVTATLVDGKVRFRVVERGGDQDDESRDGIGDDDRDDDDNRDDDGRDDEDRRDNDDDRADRDRDRYDGDRNNDRRDRNGDGADDSQDGPRRGDTDGTDD